MAPFLPPIDPAGVLPPLLACLPTAFASPRASPALLDLLAPILRQRVEILSDTTDRSVEQGSHSWLTLLCWEPDLASKLLSIVATGEFEPHPISGEIELGELDPPNYRRLDEETTQSCLCLRDLSLQAVYLWCEGDTDHSCSGWRLAELRPLDDGNPMMSQLWCGSIEEAAERFRESRVRPLGGQLPSPPTLCPKSGRIDPEDDDDDDDDGYWAQYDNTPARTPAAKNSLVFGTDRGTTSTLESDYYDRYAEVQPALDHDHSSNELRTSQGVEMMGTQHVHPDSCPEIEPQRITQSENENGVESLVHTRLSSSSSHLISHLESSAQYHSDTELASVAIKQHISVSMKSLFRLAKSTGIDRADFINIITRELKVLSMLETDD
ncbi:MAG: hypothetical protein MMC23_006513 [Stictis urceolatum]|nr:hypothetical protein [Stictis urceolata]